MTEAKNESQIISTKDKKSRLLGEDLGENWPRYSGTALNINYVCLNINFLKQINIYGEFSCLTAQTKMQLRNVLISIEVTWSYVINECIQESNGPTILDI